MQDATDVIAQAATGHIKELAAELEVSTSRLYEILSKDNPVSRCKRLIRAIARHNPEGALKIKADFDAMFAEICEEPAKVSTGTLHREAAEAIQAVIDDLPRPQQIKELRELITAAQSKLCELEREDVASRAEKRLHAVQSR